MSVGTRRKTSNPCKQIDTKGSLGPVPLSSAAGAGMLSPFGYLIKDNMRKEDLLLKFQSLIAAKHTSALQGRPNTAVRSSGRSQQQHHHALNALNRTFGHASSAGKEMMMTDQQYYLDQVRTPERKKSKRKKALRRQSLCETQNDAEVSRGDEEALTTTATTKKEYKISPIKKKKKKTIESDPQDNEGVVVLTDQITMNQGEFTSPQAVAITAKDTSNAPGSQVLISNRSSVKNKSSRRGGNDQSSKQYEIQDYNQAENAENVTPFSVQHQNLMKCEDQSERQGDRIIGRDTKPSGDDNDVYGEEENEEESNDMRSINSSKKKSIPRRYDKLREILESRNEELEKMKLAMCGCISRVKQIRIKHFSQVSLHESNQIHPSFESELALLEQCIVVLLQQVAMKSITKGTAGAQQQSLQQQQSQITIPQDIQKALAQSELLTKEAAREKEWLCGRLREKERMVEELLKALSASNSDVEVLSSEVAQLRKQEEKIRKELEQMKKNTQQQESEQEEDQKDKEKLLKKCKELQEKEGIARETNIELQLQLETSLGYLIRENDTLHREINILKGRKGNEEIIQGKQQSGNGSTQKNDGEQKQKEMGRLQVSSPKESLITQHQVQQQPQKLQQFSQDQRKFIVPQRRGSLKENTTNDHKANNGSQRQTVSLRQMASDGAGIESDSESKEKIIMLNQQDVAIIPNQNRSAKKKNSVDQQQSEEKVKQQQQQIVDSEKKVGIQGRDKKNSFNYGDNNDDIQKSHFTFQQEQQFSQGSRGSSSKKEIINENRFQRDMLNQSGIIGSQKELMQEFEQITAGKQERSDNKRNSLQRELDQQEGDDYEHDDDNSSSSGQGDEEEEKERKSTIRSSQHGDNRLNDQLGDESMYGDVSNYSSDTMQKDNKQQQYSQTPKRSRNNNMLSSEGRKDMKNENTNQSDRRKSNNGLVIGNSNEDISKQRKSTRSFGGDNNNDNGKDGGDNDSNNTEYLTFERSQHEGEGEHEQQQQQQGYNSREYQQLKEYCSNEQQHQLQLIEAEAVEKQLFEQVNNNRSRQSESQSSKNSLADSHSQMGKRTGQFGGQNSQGEIAVNNSRGSEQRILQIEQISEKKGEEVIKI